jgi:hypothetical protein
MLGRSNSALDFVRVYDSSNISIGDHRGRNSESGLLLAVGFSGTEDVIEFLKGTLSPDYESSNVTSRGKLEKVKSVYITEINALDVSEGTGEGLVSSFLVVDKKRSSTLHIASVSGLTLTASNSLGISNSLQLGGNSKRFKKSNGVLSLGDGIDISISNNQRYFSNGLDTVATSQN